MRAALSFQHRSLMAVTFGLVASVAIAILLLRSTRTILLRPSAMASLVSAADSLPYRTMVPRLSGDFRYRPLQLTTRGEGDSFAKWKLYEPAGEARQRAQEVSTPLNLHVLGVAQLLLENDDAATSTLERAVLLDGDAPRLEIAIQRAKSAGLLNDLACAYMSRARSPNRDSDLLRALPLVERAWQLDRSSTPAWNRALVYEALHLNREAAAAWRDSLSIESSDEWRSEAVRHERSVTRPTHKEQWSNDESSFGLALQSGNHDRMAQYAREYSPQLFTIGCQRLSKWASCSADQSQIANSALHDARILAAALAPDDPFLHDAIAAIDEAVATNNRDRLRLLIEGARFLDQGKQLYLQRRTDDALHALRKSITAFERASTCMSVMARTMAASCLVFAQRYEEAGAEIEHVLGNPLVRHRYSRAFGQSEWIAGLCHLANGRPYEALQAYAAAREVFERARDSGSLAALEDLEGEAYEHLGLAEESWRHRSRALALKAAEGDSARAEAIFGGAARAAVKLGQYGAALRFVESIMKTKTDDPFSMAELLVLRGAIRQRLGSAEGATNDFREARVALARLPEGGVSEAVASDIRAVELLMGTQAAADSRVADAAIAEARKQNNKFRLVPLLRLRAAVADRTDGARTEEDTEAALQEMDRQLSTIHDEDVRLTSERSLHDLYNSLVGSAVSRGDLQRAVRFLDCERERSRPGNRGSQCGELPVDAIPRDVAVLDYVVIGDDIVAFSLRSGAWAAHRLRVSASSIDARARQFVTAIQNGDDAMARAQASDLYVEIIEPVIEDIRGATTLVIAGSPARTPLPFPALWSRRNARYLIEDWTIVYTPGISRLAAAIRRDQQLRNDRRADFDILTVAPQYDGSAKPNLPPLPSALAEATAVGRVYRRGLRTTGEDATKASFGELARRSVVVHFAGHSISDKEQPRYAALAFSNGAGRAAPDMLYAYEISHSKFRDTRLLVLASCSSAVKIDEPSVVPTSLADAFLDADVPGVVATLWSIDDNAPISILIDFHRKIAAGVAAPSALRQAQISALRSGDPHHAQLRTWASYCFMGWHSGN
jgi:CHAT domain-containing protein